MVIPSAAFAFSVLTMTRLHPSKITRRTKNIDILGASVIIVPTDVVVRPKKVIKQFINPHCGSKHENPRHCIIRIRTANDTIDTSDIAPSENIKKKKKT